MQCQRLRERLPDPRPGKVAIGTQRLTAKVIVCQVCGARGADIRPDFDWDTALTIDDRRPGTNLPAPDCLPGSVECAVMNSPDQDTLIRAIEDARSGKLQTSGLTKGL